MNEWMDLLVEVVITDASIHTMQRKDEKLKQNAIETFKWWL